MIMLAILFLLSPLLFFTLDQVMPSFAGDSLTLSILFGAIGIVLLAISQRSATRRMIVAALLGLLVVAAQIYGIAILVLQDL